MIQIAAIVYVSLSEIQTVAPFVNEDFIANNKETFERMLYDLGIDLQYPYETQNVTHRNRFGNVISCERYLGKERQDKEWLESSYSSVEARDKALGSRILTDAYRLRGMTESN